MKPHLTKRWIKALRSGKYQQGNGWLKKKDKYCCLGVLTELYYGPDIFVPYKEYEFCVLKGTINCCSLTNELREKIDISYEILSELINMNDNLHYSFDQIAEYLENKLKEQKNEKIQSTGS